MRDFVARQRPPARRRRGIRQPPRLFQTRAGPAAVHPPRRAGLPAADQGRAAAPGLHAPARLENHLSAGRAHRRRLGHPGRSGGAAPVFLGRRGATQRRGHVAARPPARRRHAGGGIHLRRPHSPARKPAGRTRPRAGALGGARRQSGAASLCCGPRPGGLARHCPTQGPGCDSPWFAHLFRQPDGGARHPLFYPAPGRISPKPRGSARHVALRHHGLDPGRIQGPVRAPRPDGDFVGQRHGHGRARAAPLGAARGRPPQYGDFDGLPGARNARRHPGQRRAQRAHPRPRRGSAGRSGATRISVRPCGCAATDRLDAHLPAAARPGVCGARRTGGVRRAAHPH